MLQARIKYLLTQFQNDQLTEVEREELLELTSASNKSILAAELEALIAADSQYAEVEEKAVTDAAFRRIMAIDKFASIEDGSVAADKFHQIPDSHRIHFVRRGWFRSQSSLNIRWAKYAAAIILMIGIGAAAYLFITKNDNQQAFAKGNKQLATEIAPGGDKAVLTLADGSKIILDSAANGNLADQGGVQVVKLASGQIAYDLRGLASRQVMWNTMSTPRGGQYQVTLPDGTKVWLNAASSITFPTAFIEKERRVKINGEVYFEVSKNKEQPFLVDVHGELLVQVLGTSFNVNSYCDENLVKTTLVQGSVKVSSDHQHTVLTPGQQLQIINKSAIAASSDREVKVVSVDVSQTIAWKNGFLNLEDLDTYAVMRQLERWYDIKVRYQEPIHNIIFEGQIVRDTNLSDVVELLQKGGVKCHLEENTLVVL